VRKLFSPTLAHEPGSLYDVMMLEDKADRAARSKRFSERKAALVMGALCFLFLLLLSLAWRLTPLKDNVDLETIITWQQSLKDHPAALFWVVGVYLVSGLVLFPVMVLNVATIVTFGPVLGNAYAFTGWLCSAALGFGIARVMGRELVQKMARSRIKYLLHRAGRHGFLTVLSMRVLPVAPFTVVNLFVGASGIRFADFFLATVIGRIPGVVTLTLFGMQLESFLRRPDVESSILLAVTILLLPLATVWLCKRFASREMRQQDRTES
jgi:phospholipase D1/2